MEWEGREQSSNVDDRRGRGLSTGAVVGGAGGLILVLLALVLGVDPRQFMGKIGGGGNPGGDPGAGQVKDPAEERMADFAKVIFKDTEIVWDEQFRAMGKVYKQPVLVLFSDQVESACGMQSAAVGPFYCPNDSKVYIDLSFFHTLEASSAPRRVRALSATCTGSTKPGTTSVSPLGYPRSSMTPAAP